MGTLLWGSVGAPHCRRSDPELLALLMELETRKATVDFQILLQCPIIFTVLTVAVMVASVEDDFRSFSAVLADFHLGETGAF